MRVGSGVGSAVRLDVGAGVRAGRRGILGGAVTPPTITPLAGCRLPAEAVLIGGWTATLGVGVMPSRIGGAPVMLTASRLAFGGMLGFTAFVCQGKTPS